MGAPSPMRVQLERFSCRGMPRLHMAHPRIGPLFGPLFREIMFGQGELSRAEREMVAAVAAAAQDCHY